MTNNEKLISKIEEVRNDYIEQLLTISTSSFSSANSVIQASKALEQIYKSLKDEEEYESEDSFKGNESIHVIKIGG